MKRISKYCTVRYFTIDTFFWYIDVYWCNAQVWLCLCNVDNEEGYESTSSILEDQLLGFGLS